MIKGILFDFDGVLTLDANGTQSICNYVCLKSDVDKNIFEREYRKYNAELSIGKLTHEAIWDDICRAIGQDISIEILYDSFVNTPINSGMIALANKLKDSNFKIGMVTDNKADRMKSIIEYHKWHSFFDGIVVSADVGSKKDQEEIFLKAYELLELRPEECVFIDNSRENLIAPSSLGTNVIFFDHNENDLTRLKKELLELGVRV